MDVEPMARNRSPRNLAALNEKYLAHGVQQSIPNMNNMEEIKKKLDRIITPDGQGVSKKATSLLELLKNEDILIICQLLEELKKSKF